MAATDPRKTGRAALDAREVGGVVAAALSLPGLMAPAVHADNAPEHAFIQVKTEHYQDSQPGFKRVKVDEPGVYGLTPLGEHWSLAGAVVYDAVSGASPRYYSAVSSASKFDEKRYSGNAKLTYYASRSSWSLGTSRSKEHDFDSRGVSFDGIMSTQDNNTALNFGLEANRSYINPTGQPDVNEHRTTYSGIVGLTQAVTPVDLVQVQGGYSTGHGFFSDPYKLFDNRPRKRNIETGTLRWNHHFVSVGGTLRSSYRYYHDNYGMDSHTATLEWAQPAFDGWVFTPGLRYYTQNAAFFYIDPPADGSPFPIPAEGSFSSLDQRLAAFGAWAVNQKFDWHIDRHWSVDLKGEYYIAKSSYRYLGPGSPGLDRFQYWQVQAGIAYRF